MSASGEWFCLDVLSSDSQALITALGGTPRANAESGGDTYPTEPETESHLAP